MVDAAAVALGAAFAAVATAMALWTLYLDVRHFYGWQGGAWCFKFTHWSFVATVAFLPFVLLDTLSLGLVLAAPRRWLLYVALVMALSVDVGFFTAVFPRRLMGKDPNHVGPALSPSSAHKHLLNLLWILGTVATRPGTDATQAFTQRHPPAELVMFGVLVPMWLSGAFYSIAKAIKDPERGEQLLERLGVPLPDPSADPTDAETRGNITALPGHWIYGSFKHKRLRTAFLLSPLVYAPLAAGLLQVTELAMAGSVPAGAVLLAFTALVTPVLYVPEIWERKGYTIKGLVKQMERDASEFAELATERGAELQDRLAEADLKTAIPAYLADFRTGLTRSAKMVSRDLSSYWTDLRLRLKGDAAPSKRRSSSRRSSSGARSRRASSSASSSRSSARLSSRRSARLSSRLSSTRALSPAPDADVPDPEPLTPVHEDF